MKRLSFLLLSLVVITSCSDAAQSGPADGGVVALDAEARDATSSDATEPRDGGLTLDTGAVALDATPPDGDVDDVGALDTGVEPTDTGVEPADTGVEPGDGSTLDATPNCLYTAVDDRLVVCPGGYRYVSLFRDPGAIGCPDYWEVDGRRAMTMADAITAASCSAACLYQATQSVSFIDHCGRRNGYIVFTAPSCPDVYEFSNGYYRSVAEWQSETSCGG
ncbi:hypothetical protein L6R52_30860 [Myxococcota bacterium]|nr:hypothetical protein [Myxococcota bacterium]